MTDTPIPKCYVVVTSYIRCTCCGHNSVSSEFFARTTLNARHHIGKPVMHLERITAPLYRLPIEHVSSQRTTAFCIRCHTIDLSHLPPPPSAAQLHDLPEPALKMARHTKPPPRQPAPKVVKLNIKDLA